MTTLRAALSRLLAPMRGWRNRHFLLFDTVALALIPATALLLRTERLQSLAIYDVRLVVFTIITIVVSLLVFYVFGMYARVWRYASVEELTQITLAVVTSTALISSVAFGGRAFSLAIFDLPRSISVLTGLLTLLLVGGIRFGVRLAEPGGRRKRSGPRRRVLIMGAGDAGARIARELQKNERLGMEAIGFLDDDSSKRGAQIHGIPVIGRHEDISRLVPRFKVSLVIIAMPNAPGKTIREIVALCERAGVQAKIVPGIYELLDGNVRVSQLRDVAIEDLLRREPVETDTAAVRELVHGKRVLITGGGGSIGSELCRQVAFCQPAELIILGHGENSIFAIHNELLQMTGGWRSDGWQAANANGQPAKGADAAADDGRRPFPIYPVIADIRFPERMQLIFECYRPEIVFHAAAHKHVPLMEMNPAEVVTNNILGTGYLLDAALETGVEHFVMISTDKAVNPTSVMGASKRAAELLVHQAAHKSGRPYVAVRFGNVLGSRGSVIHSFKQQIASGGPVTVTHPDMRRYFMTIPESVQLVLQAAALGKGGEVFILDMGEPIRIVDLARDMIELSGLEVGRDIDIVFSRPRPGEKLFEELFLLDEGHERTKHEKIFIGTATNRNIPADLEEQLARLAEAAGRDDQAAIVACFQALIPEYKPALDGQVAV